jgi:hypothetical protein
MRHRPVSLLLVAALLLAASAPCQPAQASPGPAQDAASAAPAAAAPAPGKTYNIADLGFVPSGWMGDAEPAHGRLLRTEISADAPPGVRASQRWIYSVRRAANSVGWAAVAWQYPESNWGRQPGKDLSELGITEISFWAKGVADRNGRYPIVQFKSGGQSNATFPYHASYLVEGNFVELTGTWKAYTFRLSGRNLTSVISAFTFALRALDNPNGAEFSVAQIEFR